MYASYVFRPKLQKIRLSDLTVVKTETYTDVTTLLHAMICDANYIYGTDGSIVVRINPDTLAEEARLDIPDLGRAPDDMAEHGDYLYIGSVDFADKMVWKIRKNFSSSVFKSLDADKSYGALTDGEYIYCIGYVNNRIYKLDFDLNLIAYYDILGNMPNALAFGKGTNALVTTWESPAKLFLIDTAAFTPVNNRVVTFESIPADATVTVD